jgi:putative transposase
MARPLRVEYSDAIYHVTSRGNDKRAIVADDRDRDQWLRVMDRVVDIYRWRVFAFALMNNHFHLFLQTPDPNLSAGMHYLNGGYVNWYNCRYGRAGHVFQGRFKAIVVDSEGYWQEISRYVHLNPVRAGLVRRPEEWPWCSYRGYRDPKQRLRWVEYTRVLEEFGGDTAAARRKYRAFLEDGLGRKLDSPLFRATEGLVLGSAKFLDKIRGLIKDKSHRDVPDWSNIQFKPKLEVVVPVVVNVFGGNEKLLKNGNRTNDLSRVLAAYVARKLTDAPARAIADCLGYRSISSVSVACRRAEKNINKSPDLAEEVQVVMDEIRNKTS